MVGGRSLPRWGGLQKAGLALQSLQKIGPQRGFQRALRESVRHGVSWRHLARASQSSWKHRQLCLYR